MEVTDQSSSSRLKMKKDKLLMWHKCLHGLACILKKYYSLINAHNTEFITSNHWETLLDPHLAKQLLCLSNEQLIKLPSGNLILPSNESSINSSSGIGQFDCEHTLEYMTKSVHGHTLQNLGVLTSLDTIYETLGHTVDSERDVIKEFMCSKKSHEVDVMTELCASLAHKRHNKVVVDLGSGRGYLGCQLALQHDLCVLGIDCSQSNTSSAEARAAKLKKHWKSVLNNARHYQVEGGRKLKKVIKLPDDVDSVATVMEPGKLDGIRREMQDLSMLQGSTAINIEAASISCNEVVPNKTPSNCTQNSRLNSDRTFRGSYIPVTTFITQGTDVRQLIKDNMPEPHRDESSEMSTISNPCGLEDCDFANSRVLLTGLHTCGDLAPSLLRLFVAETAFTTLCTVGCCYNLLSEEFSVSSAQGEGVCGFPMSTSLSELHFELGRNARMLGVQSADRGAATERLPALSLYWRALLQVILQDLTGQNRLDWKVGKIAAKCTNFCNYVRKSLHKLGLSEDYQLTDERICQFEVEYASQQRQLQVFVQLRAALAPCIEAIIILDRACFLMEQNTVTDVHIVQSFDPVVSPRCYTLVAMK